MRLNRLTDLAVSVLQAKFGYPEVRRVLVAAMVMPHLMRHVGERMAWSLAEGDPDGLARTKELLAGFSHQSMSIEEAAKASAAPRLTLECRQGLEAFFAKRPAPSVPSP